MAIAQGRRKQRAGRRSREHALLAQQVARGAEAVRVGDRIGLVHELEVGVRRDEVFADAFDRPASDFRHVAGVDEGREHRTHRIGEDHPRLRRHRRHEAADAGERAAGADADHDGIDVVLHLPQDFGARSCRVRLRIGGVGELVDEDCARRARRNRLGEVLVIVRVALADIRSRQHDFGAHRLAVQDFLARHLVRHDQHDAIALARSDERKAKAGIAGGRLDHGAAVLEPAVSLRGLDHGARRCGP